MLTFSTSDRHLIITSLRGRAWFGTRDSSGSYIKGGEPPATAVMSSNANYEPDANPGSVGAGPDMGDSGSIAGAAGTSSNDVGLSQGGLIAIIVVVCVVTIFGGKSFLPTSNNTALTRHDIDPPSNSR